MHFKSIRVALSAIALAGLLTAPMSWAEDKADAKKGVAVGETVPDFKMKDVDGKEHTLSQHKGTPVVLVFVSNGCPWSRGADPTLSKIAEEYKGKAVVLGIDSDKNNSPDAIKKYNESNDVSYTILKDDNNAYADQLGAKQTPEVFLIDKDGKLVYHGAVDDRESETQEGKNNYVRAALDETLEGKPVSTPQKKQWGCGIKRVAMR